MTRGLADAVGWAGAATRQAAARISRAAATAVVGAGWRSATADMAVIVAAPAGDRCGTSPHSAAPEASVRREAFAWAEERHVPGSSLRCVVVVGRRHGTGHRTRGRPRHRGGAGRHAAAAGQRALADRQPVGGSTSWGPALASACQPTAKRPAGIG